MAYTCLRHADFRTARVEPFVLHVLRDHLAGFAWHRELLRELRETMYLAAPSGKLRRNPSPDGVQPNGHRNGRVRKLA